MPKEKKAFEGSAEIYDLLYQDKDYESEVDFIEKFLKENGIDNSKKIIELGCGTGNYLRVLLKRGYDLTGMDISNEMLDIARRKCNCKVFQGDISNFSMNEKFDVCLAMFDVLGYVNENEKLLKTLDNIKKILNKNGLLIFQVWNGLGVLYDKPEKRVKKLKIMM